MNRIEFMKLEDSAYTEEDFDNPEQEVDFDFVKEIFENMLYEIDLDKDVLEEIKEDLLYKAFEESVKQEKIVNIKDVLDMKKYEEIKKEQEQERKDYQEFVRIESADYLFI